MKERDLPIVTINNMSYLWTLMDPTVTGLIVMEIWLGKFCFKNTTWCSLVMSENDEKKSVLDSINIYSCPKRNTIFIIF